MKIALIEGGKLPQKMTEGAACHDVFAREIVKESDDFYIVMLGFACTPPEGYKLCLVPRSSLTKTHWVMQNSPGQGDYDFFDEYKMKFRAIPIEVEENTVHSPGVGCYKEYKLVYPDFPYKVGDRVGQIFLQKVENIEFEIVDKIEQSTNRTGGFGSTN